MASDAGANSNFDAEVGVEDSSGEEQNEEKSFDACSVDEDVEAATTVDEKAKDIVFVEYAETPADCVREVQVNSMEVKSLVAKFVRQRVFGGDDRAAALDEILNERKDFLSA